MDIDICTLTQSLPCCCLPCCLFFSSSAYLETDTAQLYNTHPDSCIEQALSSICLLCLCKTRTVHTVILISYSSSRIAGTVTGRRSLLICSFHAKGVDFPSCEKGGEDDR